MTKPYVFPRSYARNGLTGTAAAPATSGTMTVPMTNAIITITPTGACTFNTSGTGTIGDRVTFVITTSGTTSYNLTWNTNYRASAVLATGTTNGVTFSISFVNTDGTVWTEAEIVPAATVGGSTFSGILTGGTFDGTHTGSGSWLTDVPNGISAAKYGVVGDGSTDDTTAANAAFAAAAAVKSFVDFGKMIVKISGPLTGGGAGFRFHSCSYGNSGDIGFKVTGTGYVALTITGSPTTLFGTVYGTGNAANGVLMQNTLLAQAQKLRVYNLAGYGIKINKCWDCTFHDLSVEICGTTSEYAFSMNDDGDTCNMTHIGRLQAETCNRKAIYISPLTLSCVFDNIHSEGLTNADSATFAYILGGNSCQYNGMRLSGPTNTKLRMESFHCTYTAARIEASVDCELEGWSSSGITLIAPMLNAAHERTSQSGKITIVGGLITTWTGNKTNRTVYNTTITTDS